MATISTYRCTQCAYSAEVCGGTDGLMAGAITTVSCSKCHQLSDVFSWRIEQPTEEVVLQCEECNSTAVTEWTAPGACPKCNGPMEVDPDGIFMLAD